MAILLVTRHPGALAWLLEQGIQPDRLYTHLAADQWHDGDTIVGVLPYRLAAEVCATGGRYFCLDVEVPAGKRGTELGLEDLRAFGARLQEYRVVRA